MVSVETAEVKAIAMEKKAADTERELGKAETCAVDAEKEFTKQKKHADGLLKNIVHLAVMLGETSSHLASMHRS